MGKASRAKGQRGEIEVAKLLSEWSGEKVQRKLGAAREGGSDIEFQGWSIEVKRREKRNLQAWWNQCLEQALEEGNLPLLVYRKSREPWHCIFQYLGAVIEMTLEDWYNTTFENEEYEVEESLESQIPTEKGQNDTEVPPDKSPDK